MSKASLDRTVSVVKSFEEKEHQISSGTIDAFGIELTTRYNKCDEMIGMLRFAQGAAACSGAAFVKSLFYDSKSCCCFFEFHQKLDPEADESLLAVAKQTLSQFDWNGTIYHGNSCDCSDCIDDESQT